MSPSPLNRFGAIVLLAATVVLFVVLVAVAGTARAAGPVDPGTLLSTTALPTTSLDLTVGATGPPRCRDVDCRTTTTTSSPSTSSTAAPSTTVADTSTTATTAPNDPPPPSTTVAQSPTSTTATTAPHDHHGSDYPPPSDPYPSGPSPSDPSPSGPSPSGPSPSDPYPTWAWYQAPATAAPSASPSSPNPSGRWSPYLPFLPNFQASSTTTASSASPTTLPILVPTTVAGDGSNGSALAVARLGGADTPGSTSTSIPWNWIVATLIGVVIAVLLIQLDRRWGSGR